MLAGAWGGSEKGAAVPDPQRQFGGSSAALPAVVAFGGSSAAAAAWGGKIGRAAPACSTGFGTRNGAPASQQVHSTPAGLETNAIHFLQQIGPAPVTEADGQLVPWGKRS